MKKLFLLALAILVGLCYSLPVRAAMDQGEKKFEVSGEVRFRGDYVDNVADFDSGSSADAGTVYPWRVRAGIHGTFTRNVSAHIEFQNFGIAGDGDNGIFPLSGSSSFSGNTQLYQGWVELGDIGGGTFDLRLGRQELMYGNEMLLGDNDFYNGIVHDGARAAWQYKKWTLDVFATKLVASPTGLGGPFIFPSTNISTDTNFYGAYAVFKAPKTIGFDAYALLFNDNTPGALVAPSLAPFDQELRWTYGGRVYSKWDSNWSWNGEGALQTGDFHLGAAKFNIKKAYGAEGQLAYQWRKSKIRPRVYGRAAVYTGDKSGSATDIEAFNPLFQDFHARNGYMDLFRSTDLDVVQAGVSWSGKEDRHVFGVDVLHFRLNQDDPVTGENDLGNELDLYYKYAYSKNVNITAAIVNFSPGKEFDSASAITPVVLPNAPDLFATGNDNAMRVYVNTRLRW